MINKVAEQTVLHWSWTLLFAIDKICFSHDEAHVMSTLIISVIETHFNLKFIYLSQIELNTTLTLTTE